MYALPPSAASVIASVYKQNCKYAVLQVSLQPTLKRLSLSLTLSLYVSFSPLSPSGYLVELDGGEQGFDFLSRRRPGMQDRGGVRVRRRMDKSRTVPTDQQPFNELQELKEDPLFGWAQEDSKVSVGPS